MAGNQHTTPTPCRQPTAGMIPVVVHRFIWIGVLAVVTFISGMFLPHIPAVDRFRQSLTPAGFIAFCFVPFLYWEAFCRITPRPQGKKFHLSSSISRCLLIFIPAHLIFHNIVITLAPVFTVRWWPTISESIGLGIPFGCFCVIAYDRWVTAHTHKTESQNAASHLHAPES